MNKLLAVCLVLAALSSCVMGQLGGMSAGGNRNAMMSRGGGMFDGGSLFPFLAMGSGKHAFRYTNL